MSSNVERFDQAVKLSKASLRHRQTWHFWEQQTVDSSRVVFIRDIMAGLPVLPLPFSGEDGKWLFKPKALPRGWLPLQRVFHVLTYSWRLHPEMVVGATAEEGKAFPIIGHPSIRVTCFDSKSNKTYFGHSSLLILPRVHPFHSKSCGKKLNKLQLAWGRSLVISSPPGQRFVWTWR